MVPEAPQFSFESAWSRVFSSSVFLLRDERISEQSAYATSPLALSKKLICLVADRNLVFLSNVRPFSATAESQFPGYSTKPIIPCMKSPSIPSWGLSCVLKSTVASSFHSFLILWRCWSSRNCIGLLYCSDSISSPSVSPQTPRSLLHMKHLHCGIHRKGECKTASFFASLPTR